MNTTRGWTLVLGRGDEGARGRDVAVQRVAADAFAAAVAAVNRRRRRTRPKYTPRVVIVESRLLPATRAVRAAVPDADVAVAVEDDLDRLVAASAAPDGARASEKRFGTRSGDGTRTGKRVDATRTGKRVDATRTRSRRTPRERSWITPVGRARSRVASWRRATRGRSWTATLREFRRGASRRGVLAVVLNASDDAEYWDGLVIDYVVLGIRRAARRVAAEGTEREAEEEKKKKDEGGGGGDGGDGGGRRRRRLGRILGRILAGCRYFARRVECVRPVAARGCARGRSLRARRRFGSRRRFGFARGKRRVRRYSDSRDGIYVSFVGRGAP